MSEIGIFGIVMVFVVWFIFRDPIKNIVKTIDNVSKGAETLSSSLPEIATVYNDTVLSDLRADLLKSTKKEKEA